eukprot:1149150-Lingulodinium_polyedra.AAC.1
MCLCSNLPHALLFQPGGGMAEESPGASAEVWTVDDSGSSNGSGAGCASGSTVESVLHGSDSCHSVRGGR